MVTLAELKEKLESLSPTAVLFVSRIVDSLSEPPQATVNQQGTWLPAEWIEYFGLALSVHHGTTSEPLAQKSFEAVFRNACESSGWNVGDYFSETERFVDIEIKNSHLPVQKLSLKSTAAQRLSRTSVHISKLTEAAWIQDMRTARERRNRTLALFREYQAAVDSIMMLRAFRKGQSIPSMYQLVEIPTAIFSSLQKVSIAAFNSDGPVVDCPYQEHTVAARVSLDRSDSKITVRQILLSACTVHVEWTVKTD